MELKPSDLLQLIQVANEQGVDSIQLGDIQIVFKGGRKALAAAGIPPNSPLGQIAQEAAAFDSWNQEIPQELRSQIANLPVDSE